MMHTILCYGDSNTWGYDAESGMRHTMDVRWPGVLRNQLGDKAYVIEEGLNGRTTVFEEPFRAGRNGSAPLQMLLESHNPIDLCIIALGANDMKPIYNASGYDSAQGLKALIQIVQSSTTGPRGVAPKILVVAPIAFGDLSDATRERFAGAHGKFAQLIDEYEKVASSNQAYFLNPNDLVKTSNADGVHLDAENHRRLGMCISSATEEILGGSKHNKSDFLNQCKFWKSL